MFDEDTDEPFETSPPADGYPAGMIRSAADVALVIRERLPGVGVKKLHKLLYYAQAHHLATFQRPLFRESVSAWDMGPVVGTLWKAEASGEVLSAVAELDEAELNTVGQVLFRYGRLTGRDLEVLSHGERPWRRADKFREPHGSVRIERVWMQEYFDEDDEDDEPGLDATEVAAWLAPARSRLGDVTSPDEVAEIRARLSAFA